MTETHRSNNRMTLKLTEREYETETEIDRGNKLLNNRMTFKSTHT